MSQTPNTCGKKRRWVRFSLRTFLIVIAVFALTLGWYVNRAESQRRAVKRIMDHAGGYVSYSFEYDKKKSWPTKAAWIEWAQTFIPIDYISTVVFVQVEFPEDLNYAKELPFLQGLSISYFEGHDLAPIANLSRLEYLYLEMRAADVVDLAPLANLHRLESLAISSSSIRSFEPLKNLSNLQEVTIRCTALPDLAPLAEVTTIKKLWLSEVGTDISVLKSLTDLESLSLGSNCGLRDLSPLAGLTQLRELFLGGTEVADLRPLTLLDSLELLNLGNTKVEDVTPLGGLKRLERLHLLYCPVRDVEALKNLTNLKSVLLQGTPLAKAQIDSLRAALPNCNIESD